ncbi:hypothetical protein JXO52_08035 [bacterium]|nr:hypothetical protein [bacterium]
MLRSIKVMPIAVIMVCAACSLHAQNTAVGYSAAGPIGKVTAPPKPAQNIIRCGVRLFDESGDGVLTEGENASLIILMENTSDTLTVRPKLEVFSFNRENAYPAYTILFTDAIDPQGSLAVQEDVVWHGPLPTGDLPYHLIITDLNGTAKPLTVDFILESLGSGSLPLTKPTLHR